LTLESEHARRGKQRRGCDVVREAGVICCGIERVAGTLTARTSSERDQVTYDVPAVLAVDVDPAACDVVKRDAIRRSRTGV